jgi:hypothetical protein
MQVFCSKLTQPQGKNMLGIRDCNISGLLWTDTCVPSNELKTLKKESLSPHRKTSVSQSIPVKLTKFSNEYSMLDNAGSNIYGFVEEIPVFLQVSLIGIFCTKWAFLYLESSD